MTSDTFCVNPWITLHAKFTDGYNPCCRFQGVISSEDISQYIQSKELISIKQRLSSDQRIPECQDCWDQEARGYESKRQRDNRTYKLVFQALYKDPQVPQNQFIEYYVRLGNHCNLRCTTCNDTLSSGWISENKKFNISTKPVTILDASHEVWSHIRIHAATIGSIEFIGGEPFMMCQDLQRDLFKFLVDTGHASHIKIKYNTNGTRLPVEQMEYWHQFKAVEINISADGIDDQFEYLRYPAEWAQVQRNIEFYKNLQSTRISKLEITIIYTVSILNVGYVHDMLEYCDDHDLKIFINMLDNPKVLNIFSADPAIKNWVLSRIKHIDHPVIINIVKHLDQGDSKTTGQDILDFLMPLDRRRNLDVAKTFPELVKCLKSVV